MLIRINVINHRACGLLASTHTRAVVPAVHYWLRSLGQELEERIEVDRAANNRLPKTLTVAVEATSVEALAAVSM